MQENQKYNMMRFEDGYLVDFSSEISLEWGNIEEIENVTCINVKKGWHRSTHLTTTLGCRLPPAQNLCASDLVNKYNCRPI